MKSNDSSRVHLLTRPHLYASTLVVNCLVAKHIVGEKRAAEEKKEEERKISSSSAFTKLAYYFSAVVQRLIFFQIKFWIKYLCLEYLQIEYQFNKLVLSF